MDKQDLIINILNEVRKDVRTNTKDLSEMKVDVALNRQDLEIHMEQTRSVKELTVSVRDEANSRIDTIEKKLSVGYLLKLVVTVASGVGIVAGAIYGVIKLAQNLG